MANTLLSKIIASKNFKIYDEEYGISIWSDLKVKEISITAEAQTAQNPISNVYLSDSSQETQALSADLEATKVLQPVGIVISCFISSISTSTAIARAFLSVTKTYRVVAKGLTAQGMSMTGCQIDQSPDMLSAIKCELTFEQAAIPDTTGYNPASSADANTYGLTVDADDSVAATVTSLYNKVSSLWS